MVLITRYLGRYWPGQFTPLEMLRVVQANNFWLLTSLEALTGAVVAVGELLLCRVWCLGVWFASEGCGFGLAASSADRCWQLLAGAASLPGCVCTCKHHIRGCMHHGAACITSANAAHPC